MTCQELYNEKDLLNDNINKMFVTKDLEEFESQYKWAIKRLDIIHRELKERKQRW